MKTLIVYYSLEGNTEYAAKKIADTCGFDTLRLEPVKKYPDSGFRKFFWGGKSLSRIHLMQPVMIASFSAFRYGLATSRRRFVPL